MKVFAFAAAMMLTLASITEAVDVPRMRIIKYERTEYHGQPEKREAPLATFVYDLPYFGACGIFPPHSVINQYFSIGYSGGGMSPGAQWPPFQISVAEYNQLKQEIQTLDPKTLGANARYTWIKFEFDPSFDNIGDFLGWAQAVCKKHKDDFHRKMSKANLFGGS
jgi:hypothetical protein